MTVEVDNEDADTEPEPLAEPECTYKTNDQMNAESWLLVCSTIGCAAAGIGKFLRRLSSRFTDFYQTLRLSLCLENGFGEYDFWPKSFSTIKNKDQETRH